MICHLTTQYFLNFSICFPYYIYSAKAVEQMVCTRCHLGHACCGDGEVERGQAASDGHIRDGFGHQPGAIEIVIIQRSSR